MEESEGVPVSGETQHGDPGPAGEQLERLGVW